MSFSTHPKHYINMSNHKTTEQQRDKLWAAYQVLPELDKAILEMLAVIYEPLYRTNIIACLSNANIRAADGKAFVTATLKPFLDDLKKTHFVEEIQTRGVRCQPLIVELIARDLVKQKRFKKLADAMQKALSSNRWRAGFESTEHFIQQVRIGFYTNNPSLILEKIQIYEKHFTGQRKSTKAILRDIYNNPFDEEWLKQLPFEIIVNILTNEIYDLHVDLTPANRYVELAKSYLEGYQDIQKDKLSLWLQLKLCLMGLQFVQGDITAVEQGLEQADKKIGNATVGSKAIRADVALLKGEFAQASQLFEDCLKAIRKASGKRKVSLTGLDGIFLVLSLLQQPSADNLKQVKQHVDLLREAGSATAASALQAIIEMQQGQYKILEHFKRQATFRVSTQDSIGELVQILCLYWGDADSLKAHKTRVFQFYENADKAGYWWLAAEIGEIIGRVFGSKTHARKARTFQEQYQLQPLADLIKPKSAWEHALDALFYLQQPDSKQKTKADAEMRMIWLVHESMGNYSVSPKEQKRTVKGGWSKGRAVALKRLMNPMANDIDYLTEQDLKLCGHVHEYEYGYYGQTKFEFDDEIMLDLVGHPLVFWATAPDSRVEVLKAEPQLLVKKQAKGQLKIKLDPLPQDEQQKVIVVKETPTRLKVISVSSQFHQLLNIIGKKGLTVPESAKEKVVEAVSQVSSLVTIHSDIGGGLSNVESVPANPTPHVHLLPFGEGLKMAVLTQPFSEAGGGPYYSPGEGGKNVIAEIDGKRLQTERDLKQEKEYAEIIENTCSVIHEVEQLDREYIINDPEQCLELLLQLQHIQEDIQLEWPEGEKFKLKAQAGMNQFKMGIRRENDWFGMNGELKLSNDEVMDMRNLLELLEHSPGRFIKVGDNEFVALTSEFRKRLDDLRGVAELHGKGARIHPLAAPVLDDFFEEVGDLKTDKHWKEHIQRLRDMEDFKPELPSTLQAELRDYQIEGFNWLARLAHWGVGACLADDMGLGKTLQGLAMMLSRAPEGPSLVIAPTSVCMNWLGEAEKFAPTLRPLQFGFGDRQKMLDELQAFDLLVCSYGLLQQEEVAEMLAKIEFQTIVLDEAQAIKNAATKRSQAAMKLQGGFKFITTGTPIENHLGELWNLFRFINPGLLGSLENFNSRFAGPIERDQDRDVRNRLKRLIQPFILRRTKSQVLSELPERTEITLQVELSKEELAFYEALRQKAVQTLHAMDAPEGQKQLQILAEIMKLRRACCNPRLVKKDVSLPSSKLQVFSEVLEELLENKHKALVFSQFVDHLTILREHLDKNNISYQYLDGSTPAKARQERVKAFQSGKGDVFLISLKAGGVGLNLTAADYVIHMDPWWNPAVEDQASDRAHRIGQQRPVTIYRLVAQNTIEEKIVALHHQKRDLADSLLEGSDMSGKLSAKDLLNLLHEG